MKKLIAIILTFTLILGIVVTTAVARRNYHHYSIGILHTVQEGESLYLIAKRNGRTLQQIRQWNPYHADLIYPGQLIVVNRGLQYNGLNHISYLVREGDTAGRIAEKFGVSISTISALNSDINIDLIYPGQKISVLADFVEHRVVPGDTLYEVSRIHGTTVEMIQLFSGINSEFLKIGQVLNIPIHEQLTIVRTQIPWHVGLSPDEPTKTYTTYNVRTGDTAWNIAIQFGIPLRELLYANDMQTDARVRVGQTLRVPVYHIPRRTTPGSQFGEHLDWWTEAQYVFPINQVATVIDLNTETSFRIRRTIGENHAKVEPLTARDTEIARTIWGGYSRDERAVIIEVDGRRIAASASFFPQGIQYIVGNDFNGHFDIHFNNSTWHIDGRVDTAHQANVRTASGQQ